MRKHTSVLRAIREGVNEAGADAEEDPEHSDMRYPAMLRAIRDGQF